MSYIFKKIRPDETYKDCEVVGIDTDGCLLCWDARRHRKYNCGTKLEAFELTDFSVRERERLGLPLPEPYKKPR